MLGRWRTEDAGKPIDAKGELPDGTAFDGPEELKKVLLDAQGPVHSPSHQQDARLRVGPRLDARRFLHGGRRLSPSSKRTTTRRIL